MPKGCYERKSSTYPLPAGSPIDEALTREQFGYSATSVSPSSTTQKVVFHCARCDAPVDRIRRRVKKGTLCRSCAHARDAKPIKHPLGSGYEKVTVACAGCGEPLQVRKMSLHAKSQCPACRRRSPIVPNGYVDAKETKRRFGYDGATVPSKSFDKVVVRCARCEALFERIRRNVSEEPTCVACSRGNPPEANPYIDDTATQQRFGYVGTTLSRRSNRTVMVRCAICGETYDSLRVSVGSKPVCHRCRYPYVALACLDDAETERRFGYRASSLTRYTNKTVVVRCTACGVLFERILSVVKENPLCTACQFPVEDHVALDDVETEKRFGYKASDVPSKSRRKVVGRCAKSNCDSFFERARYNVSEDPGCCRNHQFGQAEKKIREALEAILGRALTTQLRLPSGKSVDIYDSVSGVGVEYCGLFWHNELSPNPRLRTYHYDKYVLCQARGIDLVTVFEDEWLQRPDVVLDILAARMGSYTRTLGARQCRVGEIPCETAAAFLHKYHVQGAPPHSWTAWGLYVVNPKKEQELMAVMTFGPHHRQGHADVAVLTRLCYTRNTRIIGGAQRLFKAALPALRRRGCSRVLSWSDNRWFVGRVYEQLGFTLEEHIRPDYSYVERKRPLRRFSKQSQRKRVTGCPADMTEHQWALKRGLARIWDCGRKRWSLTVA